MKRVRKDGPVIRLRSPRFGLPFAAAAACALATLTRAEDASALGPIDLEAGLKVGVGTNPDSNGPNPYGFGLGARGGIQLFHLYLGVSGIHYFGGSFTLPDKGVTKIDYSSTLVGAEVGYTITGIPLIDIRPQLGIGDATFSADSNGATSSTGKLYLEPGVTVLIPLGLLYVGADGNALIVPSVDSPTGTSSKTFTSFTLHGQLGLRI
jgi:hypothetical protein